MFDIVSKKYLSKGGYDKFRVKIPAGEAMVIVVLPAGEKLKTEGLKVKAGNAVIAYK